MRSSAVVWKPCSGPKRPRTVFLGGPTVDSGCGMRSGPDRRRRRPSDRDRRTDRANLRSWWSRGMQRPVQLLQVIARGAWAPYMAEQDHACPPHLGPEDHQGRHGPRPGTGPRSAPRDRHWPEGPPQYRQGATTRGTAADGRLLSLEWNGNPIPRSARRGARRGGDDPRAARTRHPVVRRQMPTRRGKKKKKKPPPKKKKKKTTPKKNPNNTKTKKKKKKKRPKTQKNPTKPLSNQ